MLFTVYQRTVKGSEEKQMLLPTAQPNKQQTTNNKPQDTGQKQTLCVTNRVVCSSRLMMGFFITCLIILMAVMFISTVYCCFGVSDSLKLRFDHMTLSPLTTKLVCQSSDWLLPRTKEHLGGTRKWDSGKRTHTYSPAPHS